jgi:hypothetical protein
MGEEVRSPGTKTGRELTGTLSEELEESWWREEWEGSNWSTDRLTVEAFHIGVVGDLVGLSWLGGLVRLRSGRLFFERRFARPEILLDPA